MVKNCKIYSFEPGTSTFASLTDNIFLNKYQNEITPFNIALWEKTELLNLHYSNISSGAALHRLEAYSLSVELNQTQTIIGYGLDNFVDQFKLPYPNLMKIDVDGGELNVLLGSQKLLYNSQLKTVFIEIENFYDSEVINIFKNANFNIVSKYPKGEKSRFCNYIFCKKQ